MSAALIAVVPPSPKALGVALVIAALGAALTPVAVAETEAPPCPNEQVRHESNANPTTAQPYSVQLPDCRAYELVSPANMGGFPVSIPGGSQDGPVLVVAEGNDVLFDSVGQPAGSGAIPNGQGTDVFESARTATGWVTTDLHPEGVVKGQSGNQGLELVAASRDGSTALIKTIRSLSPLDMNSAEYDLYLLQRGKEPILVSHGSLPRTVPFGSGGAAITFVASNPDLTSIGFESAIALDPEASTGTNSYVWSTVGNEENAGLVAPPFGSNNGALYAITPDGRPVYLEAATETLRVGFNTVDHGNHSLQISGPTLSGSGFAGLSPDGSLAYIVTADHLDPANTDSGRDIYAIEISSSGAGLRQSQAPEPSAVKCISCGFNGGGAIYLGQSADGSHVFFTSGDGSIYEYESTGVRLVAPASDALTHLTFSMNGEYLIATTLVPLSAADANSASDVYEFTDGRASKLITSGASSEEDAYTPEAVSDDGTRVIYDDGPANGAPRVIKESVDGETAQISPIGSANPYSVLSTAGGDLRDVYFAASDPIVPSDENAGDTDIYDARVDGGFPVPSEAVNTNQTPNPISPERPEYTAGLATPETALAALPPDTSHPAGTANVKPVTRAQKLTRALKACNKDKAKSKRTSCEKAVRKKYAVKKERRVK